MVTCGPIMPLAIGRRRASPPTSRWTSTATVAGSSLTKPTQVRLITVLRLLVRGRMVHQRSSSRSTRPRSQTTPTSGCTSSCVRRVRFSPGKPDDQPQVSTGGSSLPPPTAAPTTSSTTVSRTTKPKGRAAMRPASTTTSTRPTEARRIRCSGFGSEWTTKAPRSGSSVVAGSTATPSPPPGTSLMRHPPT